MGDAPEPAPPTLAEKLWFTGFVVFVLCAVASVFFVIIHEVRLRDRAYDASDRSVVEIFSGNWDPRSPGLRVWVLHDRAEGCDYVVVERAGHILMEPRQSRYGASGCGWTYPHDEKWAPKESPHG